MASCTKLTLLAVVLTVCFQLSSAQSVLDPADPVVTYSSSNPPTQPPWGQIGKWVRTKRVNWNTNNYKCYIYKNIAFRLRFPKTYNPTANDGKKYPMLIFWHGVGERAPITDNEYQLLHGGDFFDASVNNGTFDGYVIFMQNESGYFSTGYYNAMKEIIDYMVVNNKLDPFRVVCNGLSGGGASVWDMFLTHPTYIAAGIPMSSTGSSLAQASVIDKIKFTPYWNFHGGLDNNPTPYTALFVRDSFMKRGANYKNTLYEDLGHGTWNRVWTEPEFWPFFKRAYSSNPWPLFGRTEFCPNEPINVTIGLVAGFDQYEWQRNGVKIAGATGHTILATDTGTYSARVRRGSLWSDWSPIPVHITIKTATVSPDIQVANSPSSWVLPALDGSQSVVLEVPAGYVSYEWQREGSGAVLGTSRMLSVSTPGFYKVKVAEEFSCSSEFSQLFRVVNANGSPKPDPATNLIATVLTNSSVRLDWSDNPSPLHNETNFEVYMATSPGGPYTLIAITPQDVRTFTATSLNSNKTYYFVVRAINNTGAAAPSNEVSVTTPTDNIMPTSSILKITDITSTSVALSWTRATDDAGIANYEIYINGEKNYVTTDTFFYVSNLLTNTNYTFVVYAKDFGGNLSAPSNQVTAKPSFGLNYKYYHGTWSQLPNFNNLSTQKTGKVQNVSLEPRTRNDNFGFLFEGYLKVPVSGTYYFRTTSDDGSKLYLGNRNATGSPYSHTGTPVVNNDGLHGATDVVSAPRVLEAGVYPIAITFFEQGGDEVLSVAWKTPWSNNEFEDIPGIYFTDQPLGGSFPNKPSNLKTTAVSHKRINLTWNDNSTNETGFEIYRSTKPYDDFLLIARTGPNTTSYADTALKQSTTYYYRIRAVNQYGESEFDNPGQGVDYSYYQQNSLTQLPNFNNLTPVKTGRQKNFDLGMQERADHFQFKFSTVIDIPKTGLYTFYLKSDAGSRLYIDGFNTSNIVIDHDGVHTATEKTGMKNLSKGPHIIHVTYMETTGAEELSLMVATTGMPKQRIPDEWLGTPNASATTHPLPAAPLAPANLVATGSSLSSIELTWQDRSANETGFEIWRSANDANDFILFATVPANTTNFTDNGLFPNALYYYKVRALGAANNSAFTTPDSAKTQNSTPVISTINNRTARYDVTTQIRISATDADGDAISFSALNLPAFASLTDHGDRTATLTLQPSMAQQGVYSNIRIIASDTHGGSDFTEFNLTVNDNYDPVIAPITDKVITENGTMNINLSATDQNPGDVINWSVSNLPPGYSLVSGANGSATLTIQPGYSAAGVYSVVVTAHDGNGGYSSQVFKLTVNDAAPAVPNLVSAQYTYGEGVTVTWQDLSSNETGFEVWRATAATGPFTQVGTVNTANATSYVDNTAANNTLYWYKVKSKNASDASELSNGVSVFTNRVPQISAIANVLLKTNQTKIVNLTATDDPSNQITLSAEGLPSFATLSDYGNGTGQINILPHAGGIGSYQVTVKATDNYGATGSTTFTLDIVDENLQQIYLNFTDVENIAGKPWNNLVWASAGGATYSNLRDDSDVQTSITVKMLDPFGWTTATGMRTRTGKEIYPESVVRAGVIDPASGTKRIEISGLATSGRRYNFIFFSSYDQGRTFLTNYTISGQTVSLEGRYNTTNTVQINGVQPDAQGKVVINIAKHSSADYALLNAIVIQSYSTSAVSIVSPGNLRVRSTTRTSVTLDWQDRSNNERSSGGFVIYRAEAGSSSFSQIATVNANVTTYTDNNRQPGRTYFYTVRSRSSSSGNAGYSAYSNVATAHTLAYKVYVNFNENNNAGSPWNHMDAPPQIGNRIDNMKDENGEPTSLSLVQTNVWSGLYPNGVVTGNNSGVFPDNVMFESYGLFPGEIGKFKVRGLNIGMRYNFTFFASANDWADITIAWTIGERTSLFNASLNKTHTVTMYGIEADENGEVEVTVRNGTPGSQFGLIGALVIEAYYPTTATMPLPKSAEPGQTEQPSEKTEPEVYVNTFPNPFKQNFTLDVTGVEGEQIRVGVHDASGKLVYEKQYNRLHNGTNTFLIQPSNQLAPGVYFVKVYFVNRKTTQVVKVVCQ